MFAASLLFLGATSIGGVLEPRGREVGDDEAELEGRAAQGLERAEEFVRDGFHDRAWSEYREVARKYPRTEAGRTAARRIEPNGVLGWAPIELNGQSSKRVDVVVMGDGYTLSRQNAFDDLARVLPRLFEHNLTLGEYQSYFNVWRMNVVSAEGGIDGFGRQADTALGGHVRETIQGHVGADPALVMRALSEMPDHDELAVVYVQRGSHGTGYPGVAVIGGREDKTTIHEFGHAFARLQDEYPDVTGHRSFVVSRINVSDTEDPAAVPWRHWLEEKVPGIGIYEGASGQVRGAWKPTPSGCVMHDGEFFCRVCREAIVLRIYATVDPIEEALPGPHPGPAPRPGPPGERPRTTPETTTVLRGRGPHAFEVRVMRPESHALEVRWWVVPERAVPLPPAKPSTTHRDRRDRGSLQPIYWDPARVVRSNASGSHRFSVSADDLEPGTWRVLCRVRDTTRLRGESWPWVLRDERGVLESEVGWWWVID